jgi:hypothetical protein
MTGGSLRRRRRRPTITLVTVGLLIALGVVGFVVLRPVTDDSAAGD